MQSRERLVLIITASLWVIVSFLFSVYNLNPCFPSFSRTIEERKGLLRPHWKKENMSWDYKTEEVGSQRRSHRIGSPDLMITTIGNGRSIPHRARRFNNFFWKVTQSGRDQKYALLQTSVPLSFSSLIVFWKRRKKNYVKITLRILHLHKDMRERNYWKLLEDRSRFISLSVWWRVNTRLPISFRKRDLKSQTLLPPLGI